MRGRLRCCCLPGIVGLEKISSCRVSHLPSSAGHLRLRPPLGQVWCRAVLAPPLHHALHHPWCKRAERAPAPSLPPRVAQRAAAPRLHHGWCKGWCKGGARAAQHVGAQRGARAFGALSRVQARLKRAPFRPTAPWARRSRPPRLQRRPAKPRAAARATRGSRSRATRRCIAARPPRSPGCRSCC